MDSYSSYLSSRKMIIYRAKDVIMHNSTQDGSNKKHCVVEPSAKQRSKNREKANRLAPNAPLPPLPTLNRKRRHNAIDFEEDSQEYFQNQVCDLFAYLDTDTFMKNFYGDEHLASLKLLYFHDVSSHIFSQTEFGVYRNFTNRVVRLFIMKEYSEEYDDIFQWNAKSSSDYDWDSDELISTMTLNPDDTTACLVHVTVTKPVQSQVMGGAYSGDSYDSGICAVSTNVGWTNRVQNGHFVSDSHYITLMTHELGHNWGAVHDGYTDYDYDDECIPSDLRGGKYIMFWMSNYGLELNNHEFSPCSRRDIAFVIEQRGGSGCFRPSRDSQATSFCGNNIVDPGEQCDDGWWITGTTSRCCDRSCHLYENATCSPVTSPCCGADCKPAPTTKRCYPDMVTHCHEQSYCDGTNHAICPLAKEEPDNSSCGAREFHGLCLKGECINQCERIGLLMTPPKNLIPCMCSNSREDICKICCRDVVGNVCTSFNNEITDNSSCPLGWCLKGVCHRTNHAERKQAGNNLILASLVYHCIWLAAIPFLIFYVSSCRFPNRKLLPLEGFTPKPSALQILRAVFSQLSFSSDDSNQTPNHTPRSSLTDHLSPSHSIITLNHNQPQTILTENNPKSILKNVHPESIFTNEHHSSIPHQVSVKKSSQSIAMQSKNRDSTSLPPVSKGSIPILSSLYTTVLRKSNT